MTFWQRLLLGLVMAGTCVAMVLGMFRAVPPTVIIGCGAVLGNLLFFAIVPTSHPHVEDHQHQLVAVTDLTGRRVAWICTVPDCGHSLHDPEYITGSAPEA